MKIFSLERPLQVTAFGRSWQNKGWEHSGRKISENLLLVITGGDCSFTVNDTTFSVKEQDILFVPANTFYGGYSPVFLDYYYFRFTGGKITDFNGFETPPSSSLNTFALINSSKLPSTRYDTLILDWRTTFDDGFDKALFYIKHCEEHAFSTDDYDKRCIDLWFSQLINYMGSKTINPYIETKKKPESLVKMIYFIKMNYKQKITLSILSERFGLSESYIARLFKEHLCMTVSKYVNSIKLYNAIKLLRTTGMNISEVSDHCGFSSVYYFSGLFKKIYLTSPSEYIKRELWNL